MIRRGALILALAALLTLAWISDAHAAGDPSREWWTYETAHFKITYPDNLDAVARRVAILSESIHARVTDEMSFSPVDKTEVLITDDTDGANGSASPVPYNGIRLFVTAPGDISTLGDYDDWLLTLVTHEYTHILHTGNISGAAAIANRIIGRTLSPNSAQPRWIIEGLAVVLESEQTSAGRIRSSLFDAYLRADVLEDNFARLDQISSGAQRWPYGNLYYLYGSRFLQWITDIYGPDTMPAVSADYSASTIPFGVNRAIQRVTSRTYEELYDGWFAHLELHYAAQVKSIDARGRREGARISFHGGTVAYPRFVPLAARASDSPDELLYSRSDLASRTGIYRLNVGDPGVSGERDEELVVRTSADVSFSFTPEGDLFFPDFAYFRNLYARYDLFSLPRGETSTFGTEPSRKRLTEGMRANEPDVSPNGRLVAFTVNSKGTTTLMLGDRAAEGTIENVRVLVRGQTFDQAYTPRFSPDGRRIAYSAWSGGGYRDVRIVDVASGAIDPVTHDRAMDMQPVWSPDGTTLYWSSDRTGVFNVYAFDVATRGVRMVTNTIGMAITPAISEDGKTLVYTGYTSQGFDLFALALDPDRFLDAPAPPEDRPRARPEPEPIALERYAYNPLPTFGPKTYFFEIAQGNYGSTAVTFTTSASDLAGLHAFDARVRLDPGAPEPRVDLAYGFGGLPVNLSTGFTRSTVPRVNGYRVSEVDVPFDETVTSFSSAASVPFQTAFVSHSAQLSYSANFYQERLRLPERVDPLATVTLKPQGGFLSQFRLSYSLSTAEGNVRAAGARKGLNLRLATTVADPSTGSDESLYAFDASASAYVPMPWPGDQTLALRASGAASAGTYARRGNYYVGGYDFETNGPLETLISAVYDGAFVLRGYPAGAYAGSEFLLSSLEYRAPIWVPSWGPSTLPIFFRRLDGAVFADWGGAFDELEIERLQLFHRGELVFLPGMHTSIGLELWLGLAVFHRLETNIKLGYAYGFSKEAVPDGQFYVVASGAF